MNGDEPFGLSDLVLSGFVRVVTHPKVWAEPTSLEEALSFATILRDAPNAVRVDPGARHWDLFARLCRETRAQGHGVPDAFLAALAIESGCEWVTCDKGFARFRGLRWRHPLG